MYEPKATDIFGFAWVFMGCFACCFGYLQLRDTLKIDRKRGFSMGVVDHVDYCKGDPGDYYRYEFKYLDSSGYHYFIFKNINLDKKQLQLNDSLGIYYYPENPYKAYFAGDFESHYEFSIAFIIGFIAIVTGIFIFFFLRRNHY